MVEHYHLEVQANPKKMLKKNDAFVASMGITELSHDIFFKFSLRPFEVVEVESQINQNFGTVCYTEVYLTFSR